MHTTTVTVVLLVKSGMVNPPVNPPRGQIPCEQCTAYPGLAVTRKVTALVLKVMREERNETRRNYPAGDEVDAASLILANVAVDLKWMRDSCEIKCKSFNC